MSTYLLEELVKISSQIEVPKGTVLFRSGQPAGAVYIILSGRVALTWTPEENVYPMEFAEAGSILGLPAALSGSYSATARVVEHAELGTITAARVNHELDCNPLLCRAAMEFIAQEIGRLRRSIGDTLRLPAPPRS